MVYIPEYPPAAQGDAEQQLNALREYITRYVLTMNERITGLEEQVYALQQSQAGNE